MSRTLIRRIEMRPQFFVSLCLLMTLTYLAAHSSSDKVKQKAGETWDATKEYSGEKKEEYEQRMRKDLAQLGAQVEELKVKSRDESQKVSQEAKDQLAKVEEQHKAV